MNEVSTQWAEFVKGLIKPVSEAVIDYTLANMDKLHFGKRDFLIKTVLRLALGQLQTQMISGRPIDWSRFRIILDMIKK